MTAIDNNCVRNPIQSESKYNPKYNPYICSELKQSEPANQV
nr:MAG TPA: hypothetical protein [Caudoviricetes sp.]